LGAPGNQQKWPFIPDYKEGLALTNGAAFSGAMLALAVHDAEIVANTADIVAAMSSESLGGRVRAFDDKIHIARGLRGQIDSAANLVALLAKSEVADTAPDVQDAYSLRCTPQVHGASRDTIAYARMVAECEVNAATDNPLFFPGEQPCDLAFPAWQRRLKDKEESGREWDTTAYSAGNFHGQPVAFAADFLAIALAEFANISERRLQMLLDKNHNRSLPGNLVPMRGVNSGLMIAQYCAAGLVSENKVLCHPASVDSIPTSANSEDHVSMASIAARKLTTVMANVQAVLAIELMAAAQALDWRIGMAITVTSKPRREPATPEEAEKEASDFEATTAAGKRAENAAKLGLGTRGAYLAVRDEAKVGPVLRDEPLETRIRCSRELIESGRLVVAVEKAMQGSLVPIRALRWPKER
jgi:histidine ammonia-lyase